MKLLTSIVARSIIPQPHLRHDDGFDDKRREQHLSQATLLTNSEMKLYDIAPCAGDIAFGYVCFPVNHLAVIW